jgi:flagellar biogenesis protein FliO
MALRLPMLTMMVCCAMLLPQPSLAAQQSITSRRSNAPILKAATRQSQGVSAGMSSAANPLRFVNQSPMVEGAANSAADAIPADVAKAIYPSRQLTSQNSAATESNLAAESNLTSASTRANQQTSSVKQAAYLEPVSNPQAFAAPAASVAHAINYQPATKREPVKAEPDFSSVPPRKVVTDSQRQAQVEAMLNQSGSTKQRVNENETIGSLLNSSAGDGTRSNQAAANELDNDLAFSDPVFSEGEFSSESSSSQQFKQLLEKIVTSTVYVLIFAVGFIFVAKRWVKKNDTPSKGTKKPQPAPDIKVVSSLRLQAKSNLQLVEIGKERVLVASDATGIKSVVSLGSPFSSALESYEEADETDEVPPAAEMPLEQPSHFSQPIARFENGISKPASDGSLNSTIRQAAPEPELPPRRVSLSERVRAYAQSEVKPEPETDVEAEMKRKLAELLGGEAFKDVFYKANQSRRS